MGIWADVPAAGALLLLVTGRAFGRAARGTATRLFLAASVGFGPGLWSAGGAAVAALGLLALGRGGFVSVDAVGAGVADSSVGFVSLGGGGANPVDCRGVD